MEKKTRVSPRFGDKASAFDDLYQKNGLMIEIRNVLERNFSQRLSSQVQFLWKEASFEKGYVYQKYIRRNSAQHILQ